MAKEVIMPRFGMTQEEATILQWHVQEGDYVEADDPLAEVETDKVNMQVPSPADGYLGGIRYGEGDTVPVTKIIAYILAEGEKAPAEPPASEVEEAGETAPRERPEPGAPAATPVARRLAEAEGINLTEITPTGQRGQRTRKDIERYLAEEGQGDVRPEKVRATPAARRIAEGAQIELAHVEGRGPRGRVQAADVEEHLRLIGAVPGVSPDGAPQAIPLAGLRKTIAERMQASAQEAPHITFSIDVEVDRFLGVRAALNDRIQEGEQRISVTALLIKAVAWALQQHPQMNALLKGEEILLMPEVNVGVAVSLPNGLIVPVVKSPDRKGLRQLAGELSDLQSRAKSDDLRPDDVIDGTFTISNLGMFGVDRFTAILNPPQVGILAVGRTARRLVPDDDDQPVARTQMTLTLSADHRAVDGAVAARFLQDLRAALEEPGLLVS